MKTTEFTAINFIKIALVIFIIISLVFGLLSLNKKIDKLSQTVVLNEWLDTETRLKLEDNFGGSVWECIDTTKIYYMKCTLNLTETDYVRDPIKTKLFRLGENPAWSSNYNFSCPVQQYLDEGIVILPTFTLFAKEECTREILVRR